MQPGDNSYYTGRGHHHNVCDLGPNAKHGDLFKGPRFPVLYPKEDTKEGNP